MALPTNKQDVVQVIATTTSLMSICGSCAIIITLLRRKHLSGLQRLDTTDRLVLVMSILDIIASFFFGLGELPYVAGGDDGGFCQFQVRSLPLLLSTLLRPSHPLSVFACTPLTCR